MMNYLKSPPFTAEVAPVLWTPNRETGERFVSVVLVKYKEPQIEASSHLAFQQKQLNAMIGGKRAASAMGILELVSSFMREQLASGLPFEETISPFEGFTVGNSIRLRGYSRKQIVDSAIRTLSAFGTRDSYDDDADTPERNSVPTSQFLRSLRTVFSRENEERRARFNRNISFVGGSELVIDYAHQQHLVQVTSLPHSTTQLLSLQKEAESKILELDITASVMREDNAPVKSSLLINVGALNSRESQEARHAAGALYDRLKFMSDQKNVTLLDATDPQDAARILGNLELEGYSVGYTPMVVRAAAHR